MTKDKKLRMRFHRDKSVWRKRVRKAVRTADFIAQQHISGDFISMGVLYEGGRKIAEAGKRGVRLRHRMDDHGIIKRELVHERIAGTCKLLQTASAVIKKVAEAQGTPLIDFPVFESSLAVSSTIELTGHDALKNLTEALDE